MKPRGPSGMDVFDKLAQDAEQIVDEELELEGDYMGADCMLFNLKCSLHDVHYFITLTLYFHCHIH